MAEYLDDDSDDVLPLIKKTLDSVRPIDRASLTSTPASVTIRGFPGVKSPPGNRRLAHLAADLGSRSLEEAIQKADVLIEALQWIRQFRGKITVIKLGGSVMEDDRAMIHLLLDVVFMETVGMRPVLVHGGGAAISRAMAEAGLEPRFVQGRRYTDDATLAIVETRAGRRDQRAARPADRRTRRPGPAAELPHHERAVRRAHPAARRKRRAGRPGLRGHGHPRRSGDHRATSATRASCRSSPRCASPRTARS